MNSIDGDTYCSSLSTTSRNSGNFQDQPLWKRRAASLPRIARNKSKSYNKSITRTDDVKEIRINIIRPEPQEVAHMKPAMEREITYLCTTCDKSFEDLAVWRKHEYDEHERQFFWSCLEAGCRQILTSSVLFEKHHTEVHSCIACNHAFGVKRPLPSKRSWGCGFDNCEGVFDTWEGRCDHVASHFETMAQEEEDLPQPSEWKYSNVIRNLLRQPDVKDAFRSCMTQTHGEDISYWPRMRWQASSTTELKRRLDYRDFREGVKEIARMAVQSGTPGAPQKTGSIKTLSTPVVSPPMSTVTSPVRVVMSPAAIVISPVDSPAPSPRSASPVLPQQNLNYLTHIDKFPQPGTNPFDLYGPVPPSPIIQLDFLADPASPDPEISHMHSTKSSISGVPYSLYPSPLVTEDPLSPTATSAPPAPFTPPGLLPDLALSPEPITFETATTWSTAFSNAKEVTPPRPKTPLSMLRSAKSLMRKKSNGQISRPPSAAEPFDRISAQREISFYQPR